jgi:hypothetical protein
LAYLSAGSAEAIAVDEPGNPVTGIAIGDGTSALSWQNLGSG